jgi:hypothetical protein
MKRGVMWLGVLVVSVAMLLPQATAVTTWFGASSKGATDAGTCVAAAHYLVVPVGLGVSNNDYVDIWFNYTYYDNRSAGSRTAVHDFNVSAVHDGAITQTLGGPHSTTGTGTGGAANIYAHVPITDETKTIAITWKAKVTITPGCSASVTITHTIQLS